MHCTMRKNLTLIASFILINLFLRVEGQPISDSTAFGTDTATADSGKYRPQLDETSSQQFEKIRNSFRALSRWSHLLESGPDTSAFKDDLLFYDRQAVLIEARLQQDQYRQNLRFLTGAHILMSSSVKQIETLQHDIDRYINSLLESDQELQRTAVLKDTLDRHSSLFILQNDSLLSRIAEKWNGCRMLTSERISNLSRLHRHLAQSYIKSAELRDRIESLLIDFNKNLFSNPLPLLSTPKDHPSYMEVSTEASETISFLKTMTAHFFIKNKRLVLFNLLFALLVLGAIWANHVKLTGSAISHALAKEKSRYFTRSPIAAAFVIIFFFSPFFYTNLPSIIADSLILGLLASITFVYWKTLEKKLLWRWIAIVLLYIRFAVMNLVVGTSPEERWGFLLLNGGAIYLLLSSYRIIRAKSHQVPWALAVLTTLTIIQQGAAIVLNIMGYFNAALMFSVNSVFNLASAIAIKVSIDLFFEFLHSIDIRLYANKILNTEEEIGRLAQKSRSLLYTLGIIGWLLIFTHTLNLHSIIETGIMNFLEESRHFGSATYTYASLVTFLLVIIVTIWISNITGVLMDVYESYRFNKYGSSPIRNEKLFLRLIILAIGIIFGVVASGIPVEKITIIIGALSVGIGFGLQNLANNIISGFIILLEKPMKVGDIITVNSMTGRVKEIGLRSTTLTGSYGNAIIVPNGSILSSAVTNQTYGKRFRNSTISIFLSEDSDLSEIERWVREILEKEESILQRLPIYLQVVETTEKGVRMDVIYYIDGLSDEQGIRSKILQRLLAGLSEKNVRFGSKVWNRISDDQKPI